MILALSFSKEKEVIGKGGVRVNPLDFHVPFVQAVIH